MPITILTTYAPRKGYPKTEQKEHWENAKTTTNHTAKSQDNMLRRHKWETRNNKRKWSDKYQNNRTPEKTEKAEHGNGTASSQICAQQQMIPMNTWKRSPLTPTEKQIISNRRNPQDALKNTT